MIEPDPPGRAPAAVAVHAVQRDGADVPAPPSEAGPRAGVADRLLSLFEVVLCSGFPTQFGVMVALAAIGWQPITPGGGLSLRYVTVLSLADTALVIGLVLIFLRARGDLPRALFLGRRSVWPEALLGLVLVPVVLLVVGALSLAIERLAPWLHNVPENPLASLLKNPRDLMIFAVVAILAGGLREELQRAFVLDRFERHLGGALLGLVLFSAVFGFGHLLQGYDAAVLTGVLGAMWGALYLWRRSVLAPLVCHAAFNLVEVVYHGSTI